MPRPSLVPQVAAQIVDQIREGKLSPGQHLPSQMLADRLRISRAPVTAALKELHGSGIVISVPQRGFFLSEDAHQRIEAAPTEPAAEAEDEIYSRIAADRLSGKLPDRASEAELMRLYGVSRQRLGRTLYQIAEEGWAERLPGNGWEFSPMLTSRAAYEQSYQFRAAIEAAALRLPGFAVDAAAFATARAEQAHVLAEGHRSLSRAELFRINASFHEMLLTCSGNEFFLDALRRVNRLRRLIEYRVTLDRSRLPQQSREHLMILDLIEGGQREAAAAYLHQHVLGASAIKSPQLGW